MQQANRNFFTNIIHLIVNVVVGVLYTPYLVRSVGVIAYGVVPLALVINQYINVISLSLVNALTRFYSVEYRNGNMEKASKYFSTSIVVGIVFSLILYPLLHIAINYVDMFFDIPNNLLGESKLLFRFTVASFFLSILSNCVNITLFADNLLDYVNYLKVTRQALKFLLNIGFFVFLQTNILYIGLANFIAELAVLLLSIYFYKITKPSRIHFQFLLYNKIYLISMLSMVSWVLVQRFSDTFLYKIDSILMNVYFGIKMTGIIGAVSEFGSYVTSITTILSSLFAPLLLIAYSKKNEANYRLMTVEGSYIVGLFTGLLCALLCGSSSTLLSIWLGRDFEGYGLWLVLKIVVIPYTTAGAMFANSYLYANYNKRPALISLALAACNVLVNIGFLHFFHSVDMFLIVCLIFVIMQGLYMNVWFYNRLYRGDLTKIFLNVGKFTLYMIVISLTTFALDSVFNIHTLVQLFVVYIAIFILGFIVLDTVFLNQTHRKLLYEVIPVYGSIRLFITSKFKKQ